jgi:hypothetical protein
MCSVSIFSRFCNITKFVCFQFAKFAEFSENETDMQSHVNDVHSELKLAEDSAACSVDAVSTTIESNHNTRLTCPLCQQECADNRDELQTHLSGVS